MVLDQSTSSYLLAHSSLTIEYGYIAMAKKTGPQFVCSLAPIVARISLHHASFAAAVATIYLKCTSGLANDGEMVL